MENNAKKGGISVETEHIFPIIKRWLYSEKDIFLREIVSNATDAITKQRRLESLGEAKESGRDFCIKVTVDKALGTLTVLDNGIGMSEEELEKYICNIALSGAMDFIQKYEGAEGSSQNGIIGHFGLGFYSAFMVSDKVEINTRSYTGAPAVHWVCNDSGEYEIGSSDKEDVGTEIIMYINADEKDLLDTSKIKEILDKYCAFMPEKIFLCDAEAEESNEEPINETAPLWQRPASECTDEDYKNFYTKVFGDLNEPLFWIHLNADYPLNFKGILYFPRIKNEYESIEGQVKLFYNQVFVSSNIKEVIPEYLLMLKGVLDCPELPLNVSRSYLQNNTYVSKLSAHIVKKVADKLNSLKKNEREKYQDVWEDIRTFIEYACLRDKKFYDRVKDSVLLHTTDDRYMTLDEYLEAAKETNENTVYYTTDRNLQAQYISMLRAQGVSVALMEHMIDTQFATFLEAYGEGVKFLRVDADISAVSENKDDAKEYGSLAELFKKVSGNGALDVKFAALKDDTVPAILNISEETRRMEEMMKLYGMPAMQKAQHSFVVNTSCELITKLADRAEKDAETAETLASYIYKLALISQRRLDAEEMQAFLKDSFSVLKMI